MSKSKYSLLDDIPTGLNQDLTSPTAKLYIELLGEPRPDLSYSRDPQEITNPELLKLCKMYVGPFVAMGLTPAVDSLEDVMEEVREKYPDVINRLSSDGMCGVRYVGGTNTLSNHSGGAAIDLKVDHVKDKQRDDKILHGLALIAPIFNKHGWYSGAAYKPKKDKTTGILMSNEDSMHFEVSKEKLLCWARLRFLGRTPQKIANGKETRKLMAAKRPAESKRRINRGGLTVTVLAGHAKPSTPPLVSKPLPSSNIFRRPIPRRPTESFPHWLGRTATSWAKSPSSWFR